MRVMLAGVVLLVAAGVPVHASGGPGVEEKATGWLKVKRGTRVRLMVEDGGPLREVAGRLLSSDPTTLTVDTARGPQRFSRDRLIHIQYRPGRDRQKGATIGAAITGLAGAVAGAVMVAHEAKGGACDQCGIPVGFIAIAGAIPGAAIGFAIGAGGDWHVAAPDGLAVTDAASHRRATVALRLRLGHRAR